MNNTMKQITYTPYQHRYQTWLQFCNIHLSPTSEKTTYRSLITKTYKTLLLLAKNFLISLAEQYKFLHVFFIFHISVTFNTFNVFNTF